MISKLLLAVLFFAAASYNNAQVPLATDPASEGSFRSQNEVIAKAGSFPKKVVVAESKSAPRQTLPDPYVFPDAKKRAKNYFNSIAGPVALIQYAATPALLTARNSPSEWGGKWDGYGKRIGNVVGKNLIRQTTTYALDEAFKIDSKFYLSKDRSVSARLRNSVYSALTARNRSGKRVVGISRIAGSLLSEVVSSEVWYPPRFDYVHGLKGGAIMLGVNAGFNLFREFIYKK